mgnify:CR=1 FL=1
MQTNRTLATLSTLYIVVIASTLGGCEKQPAPPKPASGGTSTHNDHAHKDDGGHDHGSTTQLGEQTVGGEGGFTVKASRDGEIVPGRDAAIDVWVTAAGGGLAKVTTVRFWIGTRDAKGSVKAKAELEKDNWHTHAEIPSPLPDGSKLWVELEGDGGSKAVVGFDLKL